MAAYLLTTRRTSEVCSGRPLRVKQKGALGRCGSCACAPPEGAPSLGEVPFERRDGFVAQRHHPHLAALAAHQQLAARRVHVVAADVDQLLTAQAAAVQQFEHEPVAQGQRL